MEEEPNPLAPAARSQAEAVQHIWFDIDRLGSVVFESRRGGASEVSVVVPLYNYAHTVRESLESLLDQDLSDFSIVVVDDRSTDRGGAVVEGFLSQHRDRFVHARLVRHHHNRGLAMARNTGIHHSTEPYLFLLDADNRLRRPALSRLLAAVKTSKAAFAYSQLQLFGDVSEIGHADVWEPRRLRDGNYIDAMAMIRRDALLEIGGYRESARVQGWDDYDVWCRFARLGMDGVFLPEVLCEYRVHGSSMLRQHVNANYDDLMAEMALRHAALFAKEPDEDA